MHRFCASQVRAGIVFSTLFFASAAFAQHVEVNDSVVCDKSEQAERYVSLFKGDITEAITKVNVEAQNQYACMNLSTAFLRGNHVADVRHESGLYQIVRILVFGVVTDVGMQQIQPSVLFALFRIDERAA